VKKNFFSLVVLLFVLGVCTFYYIYKSGLSYTFENEISFDVRNGQTFNGVLSGLKQEEPGLPMIISKFHIKLEGIGKSLKTGEYLFKKGETLNEVLKALSDGRVVEYKIVIPEGYNLFEIADLLADQKIVLSKKAFLSVALSPKAATEFLGFSAPSLEGYLYPATYNFSKNTAPYLIAKRLTDAHKESFSRLLSKVGALPEVFTHHKLVTLASVVEKETGASFERPVIASVFLNRLKKGMRLQSDPTTIYGEWIKTGERLFNIRKKHLQTLNAYNTYKIKALPIGPISNPGFEAMLAVCEPKPGDYFYFVSKNDGTHYFSKTYDEHNRAVRKFQMSKKARKGKSWRDLNK
jgi:UPF0755 protein